MKRFTLTLKTDDAPSLTALHDGRGEFLFSGVAPRDFHEMLRAVTNALHREKNEQPFTQRVLKILRDRPAGTTYEELREYFFGEDRSPNPMNRVGRARLQMTISNLRERYIIRCGAKGAKITLEGKK